jgi:hypothetical protein
MAPYSVRCTDRFLLLFYSFHTCLFPEKAQGFPLPLANYIIWIIYSRLWNNTFIFYYYHLATSVLA